MGTYYAGQSHAHVPLSQTLLGLQGVLTPVLREAYDSNTKITEGTESYGIPESLAQDWALSMHLNLSPI